MKNQVLVPVSFAVLLFLTLVAIGHSDQQCEFGVGAAKQAARAVAGFAAKMYRKMVDEKPKENIIFSPVSISLALALLEAGASGGTQKELQAHLGAPKSTNQSAASDSSTVYQSLQRQLQIRGEKAALSIANGLFHLDGLDLKADYLSKMSECFDTDVQKAPFRDNLEAARQRVNQWISNATNEKIPELFKPGSLKADAVAVLANAIHMKAAWMFPFPKLEDLPFYREGQADQTQTTSFMILEKDYPYFEDDKLQRVEIPYIGELAMHIVLPKQRDGIKAIEDALIGGEHGEQSSLQNNATAMRKVTLKIPKFGARSKVDLESILRQLDVKQIFTDEADFSRMAGRRVKVSKAVHEAYIKVNENGTEAAAATGIVVAPITPSVPTQPVKFIADHPFMYHIWHKPTGAVLFIGKIISIEKGSDN